MAGGQGTGLPGTTGAEITPLVDLARSAGAAEAADADALLTMAGIAREAFDTFAKPRLVERATEEAEADAAAGRFRERMAVTEVGEAYNQALRQGTLARLATQADTEIDTLFAAHRYDPDAFSLQSAEARSRFIQSAPPELAVTLGQAWDQRASGQLGRVREARAGRDLEAAQGDIQARTDRLVREAIADAATLPLDQAIAAIQPSLTEIAVNLRGLDNPAFGMGEEQIAEINRTAATEILTGVVENEAARLLATDGFDAAMAFVGTIMEDPDLPLDQDQRASAFEASRARVQGQQAIEEQRRNAETQERNRREAEAQRLTQEYSAHIALHGEPMDGVTVDTIREMGGEAAVRQFYAATADAYEFNRAFPNAGSMTPEAFATEYAAYEERRGGSRGSVEEGFSGAMDFLWEAEGSALVADDNGAGRARYGITERSHPDAWRDGDVSREEAERIYREEYWDAIGADDLPPDLAMVAFDAAVNGGVGHARQLIEQSGGDVRRMLDLRRQHYRRLADQNPGRYGDDLNGWMNRLDNVANAVEGLAGGGNPWADLQTQARAQFQDDPAAYVGRDPMVRAQYEAWQTSGGNDGQGYVAASLDAQARAGVPAADRRSLPIASLVQIARRVDDYEGQALIDYANGIISRFGDQGERVWSDVLRVRGHTRYASMVAAAATRSATTGARPPSAGAVREAQRGEAISGAAEGTTDARQMSDDDIRRELGL
jgi:hypothetical protein